MLSLANDTDCPLGTLVLINNTVTKCSRYFLQCLLLCFGEVEVSNCQEECGAYYEDVVIVLVNGGKGTGAGLGDLKVLAIELNGYWKRKLTGNIDDKVRRGSNAHDLAAKSNREDLGAV